MSLNIFIVRLKKLKLNSHPKLFIEFTFFEIIPECIAALHIEL